MGQYFILSDIVEFKYIFILNSTETKTAIFSFHEGFMLVLTFFWQIKLLRKRGKWMNKNNMFTIQPLWNVDPEIIYISNIQNFFGSLYEKDKLCSLHICLQFDRLIILTLRCYGLRGRRGDDAGHSPRSSIPSPATTARKRTEDTQGNFSFHLSRICLPLWQKH